MPPCRRVVGATVAVGVAAVGHAALTWPPRAALALFLGGGTVAAVGEFTAVRFGWLRHHVGPQVAGVPPYTLLGWTGVVYVALRGVLVVTEGWTAAVAAGLLAAGLNAIVDPVGVAAGCWSYTDDLPGPRYWGVPWWNAAGWVVVGGGVAGVAVVIH